MALTNIKNMWGYVKEFQIKDLNSKCYGVLVILDCAVWKKPGKIRMFVGHFTHMTFKHNKVDSHDIP